MRIVALDAVHLSFHDRMVLRQGKFSMGFQMALKTGVWILPGIHNEFSTAPTDLNVFAARTVTGFTTALAGLGFRHKGHACVRTGGELADVVGMAVKAREITSVVGAGDCHSGR